jgi:hypothetical protein
MGCEYDILVPTYIMKKYKPVAKCTKPIKGTLPEDFRIVRQTHPNPLKGMPTLPYYPPDCVPSKSYTQERYDKNNVNASRFLWPEEVKLAHHAVLLQEEAFAWEEIEKGRFDNKSFDVVIIPTVDHIPLVLRNIPIPPRNYNKIITIIQEKIASGVYKESNSSYRSRWLCVPKKDGKSLQIVHDLQPLNNKVTITDSSVPPLTEHFAESFAGRACYSSLDLFVSFDQ